MKYIFKQGRQNELSERVTFEQACRRLEELCQHVTKGRAYQRKNSPCKGPDMAETEEKGRVREIEG